MCRGPVMEASLRLEEEAFLTSLSEVVRKHLDQIMSQAKPRILEAEEFIEKNSGEKKTLLADQAECDALAARMSMCSNVRNSTFQIYQTMSSITNVLSNVMMVMCACVFVGPVHICALSNFPYTCKLTKKNLSGEMPYGIYGTFINFLDSIWSVVKNLSTICNASLDPKELFN